MPKQAKKLEDDVNPSAILPMANFLMNEAQIFGLEETAHFFGVAIETLKDEFAARTSAAN